MNTQNTSEARTRRILDILGSSGEIDVAGVERARHFAETEDTRIERLLLRLGLVEEAALLRAVCITEELAFADDLTAFAPDRSLAESLTQAYLVASSVAPVLDDGPNPCFLMADPGDTSLVRAIEFHLGKVITRLGATGADIRKFLTQLEDHGATERASRLARDQSLLRATEADGPVIRYVQEKLSDAVLTGASDIHFESTETGLAIRYRINGQLVSQRTDPGIPANAIIARIKVMAEVNVAERRLPQDGRFGVSIAGRAVDFRFSSLPTHWGESIVCRVLDPRALRLGWDRLGFPAGIVEQVKAIIERPSGLFLVTGPTGSGKTTTLYTALQHLNDEGRKIVTIEDPVEYNLPGVQQIQVHEGIGLTFASVLRGILRHDPNVILVGEIRDEETAEIAARAAQVGRMVLSTLHTNSAEGAVTRLVDLGVPDFILREVLRGVLAQDLVGFWCRECQDAGCDVCAGRSREGAPVGRRLRVELKAFG